MVSLFATAGSIISRYTGRSSAQPSTPSAPPDSRSEDSSETTINNNDAAKQDPYTSSSLSIETEEESPQTTPKASASNVLPPLVTVPTLHLNGDNGSDAAPSNATPSAESLGGPSKKTPSTVSTDGSSQGTSLKSPMPPPPVPPVPSVKQQAPSTQPDTNTSSTMPPPSIPRFRSTGPQPTNNPQSSRLGVGNPPRPPPSAAAGLRVPPSGGGSRLSSSTLAPVPVKKSSSSRKVILEPGYSPLDWAAFATNPKNQLRGTNMPPGYLRVTPSMLKVQNGRKNRDAWTSYQGKVYNIQPYVPYHPGGKGELLRGAGKDSAQLFQEIHPWVNWDGILSECLVGILVSENDAQAENPLDAMD